jgi:hypothetical protein
VHRPVARVALREDADLGLLHRGAADSARLLGAGEDWALRAAGATRPAGGPQPPDPAAAGHREWEDALSAVWCRELGRERLDPDENFFDLGGSSLLLVRVQTTVNQELGCGLTVLDMFDHPTIGALARHLAARAAAPATGAEEPGAEEPGGKAPGGALEQAREQARRRQAARSHTTRPRTRTRTENDG